MTPWREKAHRVIADLCLDAQRRANTRRNGKPYKRHRPYTVPLAAQRLVDCLNRDDEPGAKAVFLALAAGVNADSVVL